MLTYWCLAEITVKVTQSGGRLCQPYQAPGRGYAFDCRLHGKTDGTEFHIEVLVARYFSCVKLWFFSAVKERFDIEVKNTRAGVRLAWWPVRSTVTERLKVWFVCWISCLMILGLMVAPVIYEHCLMLLS